MARLITKPVEVRLDQVPDDIYSLMSGTTDPAAWTTAERLLADTVLLKLPEQPEDPEKRHMLEVKTLAWAGPQERPMLVGRTTQWQIEQPAPGAVNVQKGPGNWVNFQLGIDIYNAGDVTPEKNIAQWLTFPPDSGWKFKPQPIEAPKLQTYQVQRLNIEAQFDIEKATAAASGPVSMMFVDGDKGMKCPLTLVVPVAVSERLEGSYHFSGRLDDWTANDQIQDGPLVKMLDRPTLQRQATEMASTPTRLYTGWAEDNFYVAFGVEGVSKSEGLTRRNYVEYQAHDRAWGEDLCEVLVQPIFSNNELGPVFHVVCKPNGSSWVERKLDPRLNVNPWAPFESTGIRYATVAAAGTWTGELAIPWRLLGDPQRRAPTMLRFNFAQHRTDTCESASWAGPWTSAATTPSWA